VAGRAGAGAAAFGLDRHAPIADDFHDAPALDGLEAVLFTLTVGDEKVHLFISRSEGENSIF
jgi:hypothetical protein